MAYWSRPAFGLVKRASRDDESEKKDTQDTGLHSSCQPSIREPLHTLCIPTKPKGHTSQRQKTVSTSDV